MHCCVLLLMYDSVSASKPARVPIAPEYQREDVAGGKSCNENMCHPETRSCNEQRRATHVSRIPFGSIEWSWFLIKLLTMKLTISINRGQVSKNCING